eukprot:TRINITY_DN29275_c0_g1_i1.p1 TRINITY_DN29275_c0_g1~~TRINITY_DN29275_c0_g1_i1.p1  ORF type:complete len:329 (+),score=81.41 TRINITY_DN29275_c0_g1_i1:40-1026(+)
MRAQTVNMLSQTFGASVSRSEDAADDPPWWAPRDEETKRVLLPDAAVETATYVLETGCAPLLDLSFRQIGPERLRKFSTALTLNRTVTKIDLSCNCLGDQGAEALFRAVRKFTCVSKINVAGNMIGPAGAEALAECLRVNDSLEKVSLFHNEISDAGAAHIAAALNGGVDDQRHNVRLTHLNLRENCISDTGMTALLRAIAPENNKALVVLWVGNNPETHAPVESTELHALQPVHQRQARHVTQAEGLYHNVISPSLLEELRALLTQKAVTVRGPTPAAKKRDRKQKAAEDPDRMFWTPPGTPRAAEVDEEQAAAERARQAKDKRKKK